MLNLSSLSTQSLASCVNYFVWNCLPCFSNTKIGSVTSSFDIVQFSRSCAPQPCGWRPVYCTTEVVFCQALFFRSFWTFWTWTSKKFLRTNWNFSASIGSFQGLPAEASEVILLPQRLALKYNTTPPPPCQHFLTDFFQFLCDFFWREENSSTGTILSVIAAHICTHLRIGGRCAIIYYITLYCTAEEGFVYDTHR